jgi:AhpD family alkylhydroperoxidase
VPHIDLPQLPGIVGLLVQYPRTAGPINGLADALLRGPSSLTPVEREVIAAYVSSRNECTFCAETHAAVARHLHGSAVRAGNPAEAANTAEPADINPAAQSGRSASSAEAGGIVDAVVAHGHLAEVGAKLRALLVIAEKVRVDGRSVSSADVERARAAGADDKAIHDTVLISAAFCMLNRYVDGLATLTPDQPEEYARHAKNLAEGGYLQER